MIIVTGASKGLGKAICDRLISKKIDVFGIARNTESILFPSTSCDVSSYDDVKAVVKELKKDGTLILEHEHDGRDLELSEANKVFEHINHLWHGDVRFTTIIEDEAWEF